MSDGDEREGFEETDGQATERQSAPHNPVVDGPRERNSTAAVGDGSESVADETDDDHEVGRIAGALGTLGVYLGVCSLGLAVVGLVLGLFRVQPIASLTILLSLILITISMVLGAAFQAFGTDGPLLPGRG